MKVNKLYILGSIVRQNFAEIALFVSIIIINLINAIHTSYPDEFDNILGGWYILHGKRIYADFFSHHGPVPYVVASFLEIFSGQSFVHFRIMYALFLSFYYLFAYKILRKTLPDNSGLFIPIFFLMLSFASVYFWFHMILADTMAALFFLLPVILLIVKTYHAHRITVFDSVVVSLCTFLGLFSSLTFIYVAVAIYIFFLISFCKQLSWQLRSKPFYQIVLIFILPYAVFLLYLLLSGSLSSYLAQSVQYNQRYYFYTYGRAEGDYHINPLRLLIVITKKYFTNIRLLLTQIKDFNFEFPFNITLALGTTALTGVLLARKRYIPALFFIALCVFSNARSNPLDSGITDYQSAVYIVISLFALFFVLPILVSYARIKRNIIVNVITLIMAVYSFFLALFIIDNFASPAYDKYMGTMAAIYDRPYLAPMMNKILRNDEATWIGPLNPEDLFYLKPKIASKYIYLLPDLGKDKKMQQDLINEWEHSKPKVIYYDRNFHILGRTAQMHSPFFINYIDEHYVKLNDIRLSNVQYKPLLPNKDHFNILENLYVRKDSVNEIMLRMLEEKLIEPVSS